MENNDHTRFYIDLTKEENDLLKRLAAKLTADIGVKFSKLQAIRFAIKKAVKK